MQGLQTELKRNKSERLFAQAAGVHCVANGQAAGRLANICPSLGRARRAAPRRGVLARVKRPEARPSWISFRNFRASLLSMIKDATPNGILRFACQCVEAKFKKREGG